MNIQAEQNEQNEILKGLLSSFNMPFEELLQKKHASEWENLFDGFSGNLSINAPTTMLQPNTGMGDQSATIFANIRYQPLSYWFAFVNCIYYLQPKLKASWEPDFTYTLGYDDWHPYTLSLVYQNYQTNNFIPNKRVGQKITRLEQGTLSLGWKFKIPETIEQLFIIDDSSKVACNVNYNLTPSYFDVKDSALKRWKYWASLNCTYNIWKGFYVQASSFYYPNKSQKQLWDQNFTYSLGYADLSPGGITIQYQQNNSSPKLIDGSLLLNWALSF